MKEVIDNLNFSFWNDIYLNEKFEINEINLWIWRMNEVKSSKINDQINK